MLSALDDASTSLAVHAERAVSRTLGGSCSMPLAAHAVWNGQQLQLEAALGHADDPARPLLHTSTESAVACLAEAEARGERAAASLLAAGAGDYLPLA
jgi:hydroxymethylbilane synthase